MKKRTEILTIIKLIVGCYFKEKEWAIIVQNVDENRVVSLSYTFNGTYR